MTTNTLQDRPGRLAALVLGLAAAAPAWGQVPLDIHHHFGPATHIIIPQARPIAFRDAAPRVQIAEVQARVSIMEQTATTTLDIALSNPARQPLEAVLLLPVPDDAVVSAFDFDGPGSEPSAELLPRDEARRLYDSIVASVRDPALLEFAGYNLIRSSVFPVPAEGGQRLRVTYESILSGDGNRFDYLLPRSESLDRRCPWRVTVELRSSHPVSMVYSPSHDVVTERRAPGRFHISLANGAETRPGPFRLSYLLERNGVTASLLAYPDPTVGGGYFLLMAGLPAAPAEHADSVRREVTIVLDRSGSMAGVKMDQALAAARQIIEGLRDGEAFNIIDYSTTVAALAPRPLIKSPSTIHQARTYLSGLRPGGGTNIHDALIEALRQPPVDDMLPIVLFLTDGLPTVGRTQEMDIRGMVEHGNPHQRRVFTFGVGHDVNVPLLDRLAELTRARATYILPDQDVELAVAQAFSRLYGPVLSDAALVTVDPSGAESTRLVRELIPARVPDLFEGDQLILLGQYVSADPVRFRLSGTYLGRPRTFEFAFNFDAATTRHAFVPRLWASRRIAFLVDQIRQSGAGGGSPPLVPGLSPDHDPRFRELVGEILRLSTEFGILTEYTAFLATEGTSLANWNGLVEACSSELDSRAVRTRSGAAAINQSFNVAAQKSQTTLNPGNRFLNAKLECIEITGVQQVCDRAFFHRDGRWVDGRLIAPEAGADPVPDVVIEYGSPQHLAVLHQLIAEHRQGVLSLDGEILLDLNGRTVLVRNAPASTP
jgi:Ca-activated chloride channel family protein